MGNLIITIDGPAASGKSTVARLLAEKLAASFLDTGAMYRAVTLAAIENGVDMSDEQKLLGVLNTREFRFAVKEGKMVAYIDGVDVSQRIRDHDVTANARHIAAWPRMREKLVEMQRQFAASQKKMVTEGRDQGTVVFPNADIKFYLTADITERARRRQAQLRAQGASCNLQNIKKAIQERDKSDSSRKVAPLKPANDAIIVDTTNLSVEKVVEKLFHLVEEKCSKKRCK